MATPAEPDKGQKAVVSKEYLEKLDKRIGYAVEALEKEKKAAEREKEKYGRQLADVERDYVGEVAESPYFWWSNWHELESKDQVPTSMQTGKILEANLWDMATDFFLPEVIGIAEGLMSSGDYDVGLSKEDYGEIAALGGEGEGGVPEEIDEIYKTLSQIEERQARRIMLGCVDEIEEEYMDEDGNVTQEAYRESQDRAVLPRFDSLQTGLFSKSRTYVDRFGSEDAKYKITQEIKGEGAR